MRHHTIILLLLAGLALAGCAGPAKDCNGCPTALASNDAPNSQAAAAATEGGQDASQAPFSGEAGFRSDPTNTMNSGAGDNTSHQDGNSETRTTASGAAQNVALNVPATATAQNVKGGGGTALAIRLEYARDLQALRDELTAIRHDLELTPEQRSADAAAVRADMRALKADMALALSHVGKHETTYNQQGLQATMFGVSTTSSTPTNPEALKHLKDGLETVAGTEYASLDSASADAETPEPPAGPAGDPLEPSDGGGP